MADFIGESNILDGVMLSDYNVKFFGRTFKCLDAGFEPNEPVDVVIRPEDIDFPQFYDIVILSIFIVKRRNGGG